MSKTPTAEQLILQGIRESKTMWLAPNQPIANTIEALKALEKTGGRLTSAYECLVHEFAFEPPSFDLSDGPQQGLKFRYKGKECKLTPMAWKVLDWIWSQPGRTSNDHAVMQATGTADVKGSVDQIKLQLGEGGIQLEIRRKNRSTTIY